MMQCPRRPLSLFFIALRDIWQKTLGVLQTGQVLLSEGNYRQEDVGQMLRDLNITWEELVALSRDKGRRLQQAAAQHTYNRTMEDARLKLEEMEFSLQSLEVGTDLRHCKELLKKHQVMCIKDLPLFSAHSNIRDCTWCVCLQFLNILSLIDHIP